MPNWSLVRTRSRWEKKVAQLIAAKGIEVYCPLVKERRKWSDRMKVVEQPLLKGFIFVRITEEQRTAVRLTNGIINFIYKNGEPVVVKDKLVQQIKQFQGQHSSITVAEVASLVKNDSKAKEQPDAAHLVIDALNIVLTTGPDSSPLPQASTDKSEKCVS